MFICTEKDKVCLFGLLLLCHQEIFEDNRTRHILSTDEHIKVAQEDVTFFPQVERPLLWPHLRFYLHKVGVKGQIWILWLATNCQNLLAKSKIYDISSFARFNVKQRPHSGQNFHGF